MSAFHSGYASFMEDRDWGAINKKGEVIIRAKYDHPIIFDNGLAPILNEDKIVK